MGNVPEIYIAEYEKPFDILIIDSEVDWLPHRSVRIFDIF